ncbi:nucleotidyltransferase family protein [Bacillus sp. Bva_UNVM-123]|uniref:nucleotidyltransferase family protein n=1 Tax=Bacillus sp. Bva_UNVM-123 TaxID=2829798 RepID=UPI00391F596F
MLIKTEDDILSLIREDKWMMDILQTAKLLELPDWWICAGFVRSKIWDALHDFSERTPLPDIDVIYFDPVNIDEFSEKKYEERLMTLLPHVPWSVKNEARMHMANNFPPYDSSVDAISKFPETASALGITIDSEDSLILAAPWGIADVLHFEIRPTPFFAETKERYFMYEQRIKNKNWSFIWKKVKIIQ